MCDQVLKRLCVGDLGVLLERVAHAPDCIRSEANRDEYETAARQQKGMHLKLKSGKSWDARSSVRYRLRTCCLLMLD
jgi:hypothetical protein